VRVSSPWSPAAVAALAALLLFACGDPRAFAGSGRSECTACHGGGDSPAPPTGLGGETSTTQPAVGAHRLHLRDTPIRQALPCSECHRVPASVDAPGHFGGPLLVWGPLAAARGSSPSFEAAANRCSGVYCHGGNPSVTGGAATAPSWTYAEEPDFTLPPAQSCTGCHGWPPPPPHPQLTSCAGCHGKTVAADGTIDVAGGRHVNGVVDFGGSGGGGLSCDACHGYPPATGAHLVHFGWTAGADVGVYGDTRILADYVPLGAPRAASYAFGCGNCHPLDPAKHMDGTVEVELSGSGAPPGSLKSLNPAAASYASGSCASVYCHSSGQATDAASATPVYAATPPWTSGQALGCASCHADPPRYPTGGPGAVTANTHAGLAYDGYVYGHFLGQPGPWHPGGSKHGGDAWGPPQDASPITCQTCHYGTVDPANTGPSGFYYLDAGGDYAFPGEKSDEGCARCHRTGDPAAPVGSGRTLPLLHVNGRRDVVFDPRTGLPGISWLPAAPFAPSRPAWVTGASPGVLPPSGDGVLAPVPVPPGGAFAAPTLSQFLSSALYDPATKTCSNVACHLAETSVQWGGAPSPDNATCKACHGL